MKRIKSMYSERSKAIHKGQIKRLKKGTIDLRHEDTAYWVATDTRKEQTFRNELEAEAIREWGEVKYEAPKWLYPDKKQSVGWYEFLTNVDYKRVLRIILP